MSLDFQELLKTIKTDVEKNTDKVSREEQLVRLNAVYKVYSGEDQVVSTTKFVEGLRNQPEQFKMLTGWTEFDKILQGFRLQQVITVVAMTKSGKTSFCLDITAKLEDYSPLWLPYEEGAEELLIKWIERNQEPPKFYTPLITKPYKMDWLEERVIESVIKYNTQIVFVDHLHFLLPKGSTERVDLAIGEIMRELKTIAKKWNVCIVLIAHTKKAKMDIQPTLDDIRDSSFVGQESDTVIVLWRENKREKGRVVITNRVNVSIQAARRFGKTGNIMMRFEEGHFYEEALMSPEEEASLMSAIPNNAPVGDLGF